MSQIEKRIEKLEARNDAMKAEYDAIKAELDALKARNDSMKTKLNKLHGILPRKRLDNVLIHVKLTSKYSAELSTKYEFQQKLR